MDGKGLLSILIEATGLPPESVERELTRILSKRGLSAETVTLEDLREVLASYLQDALIEAKNSVG